MTGTPGWGHLAKAPVFGMGAASISPKECES